MTHSPDLSPAPKAASKGVPEGLAKGIIGFVLGAGLMYLALTFLDMQERSAPLPLNGPMPHNTPGPMLGGPGAGGPTSGAPGAGGPAGGASGAGIPASEPDAPAAAPSDASPKAD